MQSSDNLLNPELINIRRLFTTPLASIQYPNANTLNAELKSVVTQRMAQDQSGAQRSNDGGWQSAFGRAFTGSMRGGVKRTPPSAATWNSLIREAWLPRPTTPPCACGSRIA